MAASSTLQYRARDMILIWGEPPPWGARQALLWFLLGLSVSGCGIDERNVGTATTLTDERGEEPPVDASGASDSPSATPSREPGTLLDTPGAVGPSMEADAGRTSELPLGDGGVNNGGGTTATECVSRTATFRVLDSLVSNVARAVSADGVVVVGDSDTTSGRRAFRWSATSGIENLGTLPGGTDSSAVAVSADGSVVVGFSSSGSGERAFRWSAETGMQDLGVVATGTTSSASAVSADGSVVVGSSNIGSESFAFRWTGLAGMVTLGAGDATGTDSVGAIVVGYGSGVRSVETEDAFRWTSNGGRQALGPDAEPAATWPSGVSSDGQVIVGYRLDVNRNYRAFRWSEGSGFVNLPTLPGDTESLADCYGYGTNRDGTVVVGADDNGTSSSVLDAFVWTAATGTVRVADRLPAGIMPAGWRLRSATAVSADGHVIVGAARETFSAPDHAWVATLARACP